MKPLHCLVFTAVEDPTEHSTEDRNDHGDVVGYTADPGTFQPPYAAEFAARLDRVMADADSATCDMPDCSHPIGWVLHEDDDEPWRSGLSWRWTTLVATGEGRPVLAVCEDDDPGNLYDHAADEARKALA